MRKRSESLLVLFEEQRMLALLALALVLQSLVAMLQPWPLQGIFDYVILAKPIPKELQLFIGNFWNVTSESLLAVMIVTLILVALLNGFGLYLQNSLFFLSDDSTSPAVSEKIWHHPDIPGQQQDRPPGNGQVSELLLTRCHALCV